MDFLTLLLNGKVFCRCGAFNVLSFYDVTYPLSLIVRFEDSVLFL